MLWKTWQLAKQFQRRPSEFIGLEDAYSAWCFDEAVFSFGSEVDDVLQHTYENARGSKAVKRGATENALRQMLGMPRKYASVGRPTERRPDTPKPFREE